MTYDWAVLDVAVGHFGHPRGPFWFMGRFGIDPRQQLLWMLNTSGANGNIFIVNAEKRSVLQDALTDYSSGA